MLENVIESSKSPTVVVDRSSSGKSRFEELRTKKTIQRTRLLIERPVQGKR